MVFERVLECFVMFNDIRSKEIFVIIFAVFEGYDQTILELVSNTVILEVLERNDQNFALRARTPPP